MASANAPNNQDMDVFCPKCSVNVLESGFILETVTYEAYTPDGGKLRKSQRKKSGLTIPRCALCGTEICVSVQTLTAARKEAA